MKKYILIIEKYIVRSVIIGIIMLVFVQSLMRNDTYRFFLSWGERLEGQSFTMPAIADRSEVETAMESSEIEKLAPAKASVIIKVEKFASLPNAWILVNGDKKTAFNDKEVKLEVIAGDVIEINAAAYNFPIEFTIIGGSPNLAFPEKNKVFKTNQSTAMIGKILVK